MKTNISIGIWTPASESLPVEGRPESLIGKQCRTILNGELQSVIYYFKPAGSDNSAFFISGRSAIFIICLEEIEWLNDSEEAVNEVLRDAFEAGAMLTDYESTIDGFETWLKQKGEEKL